MRRWRAPRPSAATNWLEPEDVQLQQAFRRRLGLPGHLQVPLIDRLEGDRIWLRRDQRGASCLLPALCLTAVLAGGQVMVLWERGGFWAVATPVVCITLLLTAMVLQRSSSRCSEMIDLGAGTITELDRWRWRPGPVRTFRTRDLYLYVGSTDLFLGGDDSGPGEGVIVFAVSRHPDEWDFHRGRPELQQYLIASNELAEDRALAAIEPGVAALQRVLPWKGAVVRSTRLIPGKVD